jgi:hypothetical protein
MSSLSKRDETLSYQFPDVVPVQGTSLWAEAKLWILIDRFEHGRCQVIRDLKKKVARSFFLDWRHIVRIIFWMKVFKKGVYVVKETCRYLDSSPCHFYDDVSYNPVGYLNRESISQS